MATVAAICISERRGEQKHPIPECELREDWGIVGDAHAGNWHRQVSLLAKESVGRLQQKLPEHKLKAGDFAENLLLDGFDTKFVAVGQRLRLGESAVGEVTQIGKECHNDCVIRKLAGDCVMPREGIFLRILRSGTLRVGDSVSLLPDAAEGNQE